MLKLAMFLIGLAFAHGEEAPGPHGGHIIMPANFHTEVVLDKNGTSFQVYLIDIQFKNPLSQKSSVSAKFIENKKINDIKCTAMDNHFMCEAPFKMKKGTLSIQAKRNGVTAPIAAKYELPLQAFKTVPAKAQDHSMHH